MALIGGAEFVSDWHARMPAIKGFALYAADPGRAPAMREAGVELVDGLDDLLASADIVVDCTPKKIAALIVKTYREKGIRFIVHGSEKHGVTGHSFVAETNYASAVGRDSTRVVYCNTTSIVRTTAALGVGAFTADTPIR